MPSVFPLQTLLLHTLMSGWTTYELWKVVGNKLSEFGGEGVESIHRVSIGGGMGVLPRIYLLDPWIKNWYKHSDKHQVSEAVLSLLKLIKMP